MKDGGPAFPSKKRVVRAGYATEEFEPVNGMTLRDYFAAKAMQAMLGWDDDRTNRASYAEEAYEMAEAMIQARSKHD